MAALVALEHTPCELGEGPTYDPHTDTAWWFDITARKLYEYGCAEGRLAVHDLPMTASALARVDHETQVLFTEHGLYRRDMRSGALSLLCAIEEDMPVTRSNDARVHPSGAMWLGTMGWNAEVGVGSIWHYRAGTLTRLFEGITITNAICFSPDGGTGYFADTHKGAVYTVRLDPETGLPLEVPSLWRDSFDGGPDGAVVDAEGHLWIAVWGSGAVVRYAPSGQEVSRIELPASQPSCPAFVGANAERLLITTATYALDRPEAGDGLSYVIELDVPGTYAPDLVI